MLESLPSSSATDNLHALCLEAAFREWKRNSDSSFDFRIVSAILEPQFRREKKLLLLSTPFLVSILAKFIPTHFLSLFVKKKKKFEAKGRREKKKDHRIDETRQVTNNNLGRGGKGRGERESRRCSFLLFRKFPERWMPLPPRQSAVPPDVRVPRDQWISRPWNKRRNGGTKGGREGG